MNIYTKIIKTLINVDIQSVNKYITVKLCCTCKNRWHLMDKFLVKSR